MRNLFWLLVILSSTAVTSYRFHSPIQPSPVLPICDPIRPTVPVSIRPTPKIFEVDGVRLGMTRDEVRELGQPKCLLEFSRETGKVCVVDGTSLGLGSKVLLRGNETAFQVRTILGRPTRTEHGHVLATVAGFFWHYDGGLTLSFIDDHVRLDDKAPIFQIFLVDHDQLERDRASLLRLPGLQR